jgi:hypothetical protein
MHLRRRTHRETSNRNRTPTISSTHFLFANRIHGPALRARRRVELSFSRITWEERSNKVEMFYGKGEAIQDTQMYRCKFEGDSEIVADARTGRTCFENVEEWPIAWPSD